MMPRYGLHRPRRGGPGNCHDKSMELSLEKLGVSLCILGEDEAHVS
jgi:hypothetical protein